MQPRLLVKRKKFATVPHRKKPVRLHGDWTYVVWDPTKKLSLREGTLSPKDLQKPDGSVITSSKGFEFFVLTPGFNDLWSCIKKGPQNIPLKDLAWIAAKTGATKSSVIVDIGGGSGGSACFFARMVKHVYSYELRDDHCDIIKENARRFGLKNITVTQQDVVEKKVKRTGDVVMIDLPSPWLIIEYLSDVVKLGGYVVNYSPPIVSTHKFVEVLGSEFQVLGTHEIIVRPWKIEGNAVRPTSAKIGHSGFITIARRIT